MLTGGGGRDTFVYTGADATLQISGSGINGNVTGFGQITDFAAGATAASSELLGFSARTVGFSFSNNNSTLLLHTGETIKSHTISNGIVAFNDGTGIQSLITLGDVAAATQYMSFNDWGDAGATLAFTATLSGVSHTFVYTQTSVASGLTNAAMVDLVNVSATGIVSNGTTLSVLDQAAPNAPSITSIAGEWRRRHQRRRGLGRHAGGGEPVGHRRDFERHADHQLGRPDGHLRAYRRRHLAGSATVTVPAGDDLGAGPGHVRRDGHADRWGGQCQPELDGDLGNGRHGGADCAVDHLDHGKQWRRYQRQRGLRTARRWWWAWPAPGRWRATR